TFFGEAKKVSRMPGDSRPTQPRKANPRSNKHQPPEKVLSTKKQKTYPCFLCATLWITMFTSRQTRANASFAGAASELTSGPTRFIHEAPFYQ
ncbi:hypothetical protein, partial [Polaromonas sp.]|uniref:hypothetical protein n=1 Tax=Polaromonas sp. TaxID=1869339 RepID=UPI0025F194E7